MRKPCYEWIYRSGSDSAIISLRISTNNFGNIAPAGCSILDKARLLSKLDWTDPRYANSKPPDSPIPDTIKNQGTDK